MSSIIGCDNCGSTDLRIQEWWADDHIWMHVMGKYEGVLCAPCFDSKARKAGWFLRWKPEQYPGVPSPIEAGMHAPGMSHGDFLQAFGRAMAAKVATAEELILSLRRERDAALAEVKRLEKE